MARSGSIGPGRATLVATLASPPQADFAAAVAAADQLEVRADLVGDLDPATLRARFRGPLLYTLRSRAEGGAFEGSAERRKRRLIDAAARFDRIDLEAARDLTPDILAAIPAERRVVSWHGPAADLPTLTALFERLSATPAALYKLVPAAVEPGEELPPLALLHQLERSDVIAFASGTSGAWTRLIAPYFGAAVVYAAIGDVAGAPGQLPLSALVADYGLPSLPAIDALYGIVGNPVFHSLSPRIHNGAYRELGLPALYLPFQTHSFGDFWLEIVEGGLLAAMGLPLRGLSVTAPFKEAALAVAGAESPLASLIGAANTLVWNDGVWEAESTDPEGVVLPLAERGIAVAGLAAAVVGSGGGGRSAAVGLARAGAAVTLVNRGEGRGLRAAEELALPFVPLADFDPAAFDLIVHSTSLGRAAGDTIPFPVDRLRPGTVVIDLVYRDGPTPLLTAAAERGAIAIDGREVLLDQALGQMRLMTGHEMPVEAARRRLGLPTVTKGSA